MLQQQTLRESVSYAGVGLHGGNKVNLTFLPAPAGSGIRFRRVDLDGKPEVEAKVEHVTETNRSTTISKGNVKIHTVEHVLSAFSGLRVDNAVIELDASEPPIGDGSSLPYSRMIQSAGLVSQPVARDSYKLTAPIEFQLGESMMSAFPHDGLKVTCTSADKQGRFTQFYSVDVTPESWQKELAPARTFCFYEEIEYLIKNGLIKGGSLENAVVIRGDAVLTTEPLRFTEEFVRHKILDVIGDLALVGRALQAHVVAIKPSHAANCELARLVLEQIRKPLVAAQSFAPPPAEAVKSEKTAVAKSAQAEPTVLDIQEIMKILPHRFPFLLVDRVTRIEGNKITGVKNVSINESFFQGHFPGHPVMPGVLQLEAIAQVAGILMLKQAENWGKIAYFMSAESVKWRRPVRPGDRLVVDVELTKSRGKIGKARGVCTVDGEVVSEADVAFMLMDR